MSDPNPFFESFSNTEETPASSTTNTTPEEPTPSTFMESNPFDNIPVSSSSSTFNNSQNKKYYIRDNYWFVNMKLYRKEKLDNGEASLITISFNSQYDNMRIVFLQPGNEAFSDSAIVRSKCKVITTANVFAETCEALLYYYDKSADKPTSWHALERLIQANSEWKPNRTKFDLNKKEGKITIFTVPANNKTQVSKFTFEDFQLEGFLNACRFMRKEAWIVSNLGQFMINN